MIYCATCVFHGKLQKHNWFGWTHHVGERCIQYKLKCSVEKIVVFAFRTFHLASLWNADGQEKKQNFIRNKTVYTENVNTPEILKPTPNNPNLYENMQFKHVRSDASQQQLGDPTELPCLSSHDHILVWVSNSVVADVFCGCSECFLARCLFMWLSEKTWKKMARLFSKLLAKTLWPMRLWSSTRSEVSSESTKFSLASRSGSFVGKYITGRSSVQWQCTFPRHWHYSVRRSAKQTKPVPHELQNANLLSVETEMKNYDL